MRMLKRLKTLWKLTTAIEPKLIENAGSVDGLIRLQEELLKDHKQNIGNGNAIFLPEMTEEEYKEYMHNEVHGWKKFTNMLNSK